MRNYQTFLLSEEPKFFGIPILTGVPTFLLTAIGLVTGYSMQLFVLGMGISVFMHVKFGGLPIRQFWGMVYWFLPKKITFALFRRSPDSANRLYIR